MNASRSRVVFPVQIAMLNDFPPETADPAELERMRRDALCPSERADAISYDWAHIGFGVVLAGGLYPVVLAAILTAYGAIVLAWSMIMGEGASSTFWQAIGVALTIGLYAIIAGMIGVLWTGLVAVLTLPTVYLVAWSLQLQVNIVRIGAFAGGLVGFVCLLPAARANPWMKGGTGDLMEIAIFITLGPVLTTVMGQLGGAWGGSKSRECGPTRTGSEVDSPADRIGPAEDSKPAENLSRSRIQFGIRHLLWVSVWLSLLLALIRGCGIPFQLILPLLFVWFLFQAATLWIGGPLMERWVRWRERRRKARST
jgi:nitrate reductase NapE component